jgi:hypothetical protein
MKMKKSHVLLAVTLCATLVLAWFAPNGSRSGAGEAIAMHSSLEGRRSPAIPQALTNSRVDASMREIQVLAIHTRADGEDKEFLLFQSKVVDMKPPLQQPSVVQIPASIPPATPQAPPLPFLSVGRYSDGATDVFFLQQGIKNIAVHIDEVIDQNYKVESFDGNTLSFRYIPLNLLQTLEIGISN